MKKRLIALLLAAAMVVTLAACGSSDTDDEETEAATEAVEEETEAEADAEDEETEEASDTVEDKGTIKVGHLLDLTGAEASTGAQAQAAFEYAVATLEAKTGYTIEVVEGDCQSDASAAATAALSMIEEGCIAIFGPTQIGHKSAVAGAVEDNGVPLIYYNGTPVGMVSSSAWVVGLGGGTAPFPTVMADYAYNVLGLRTVYVIKQDSAGGDNYVDPFITCFEAMGGTVVGTDAVAQGTSDYSAYVTKILNSDAEAIVGWVSSSDAIAFFKELYNQGSDLPIVATMHGGFTDYYVMNAVGEEVASALLEAGTYAPINYCYSIESDANAELVEGWQEAHDGAVPGGNNLAGSVYQALQLFLTALDSVGTDATSEELMAAILDTEIDGPEGHTVFEDSQVATKDVYVVQGVQLEDESYNYQVLTTYEQVSYSGYNYDLENDEYIG